MAGPQAIAGASTAPGGIRTILVCLTTHKCAERLTPVACELARRFGAHLIGIHTMPALSVYPGVDIYLPPEQATRFHRHQREMTDAIRAVFEKAVAREDFVAEWREPQARAASASHRLVEHARCADLVIMAQADPDEERVDQRPIQRDVIQQAGRPVLMVPFAGTFPTVGTKILVGWSATREATRAVHDALPFMVGSKVRLMWVSGDERERDYLDITAHEMAAAIHRHGGTVEVDGYVEPQIAVGDVLLNEAFERGADMIVTGAYGHSRFYDFVIGAVTTHLLRHMTVPVLFSY